MISYEWFLQDVWNESGKVDLTNFGSKELACILKNIEKRFMNYIRNLGNEF